jgi:drug/metabolite transporter (DMT)-like permease
LAPVPLTAGEIAARLRGIGLYCLALLLFACVDTIAKYSSRTVPVLEVAWLRYVGATIVTVVALRPWRDLTPYRTSQPLLQIVRSALLGASTVFNFMALRNLQLAETTTISFAGAFVVAGLAGPLLGEWIGPRRWIAILVGFAGVVIVTRPGPEGIQPAVLLSMASMLSTSFYVLLTRRLAPTESADGLLLYPAVGVTVFLAPVSLPAAIMPPTAWIGVLLAVMGLLAAVGHWCLIHAHRLAPAGVLSPFVYFQLIWMTSFGYLAFGDLPHPLTLVGAAVIIASGLYILYRQHVHGDH